jgi:hypothetical protein
VQPHPNPLLIKEREKGEVCYVFSLPNNYSTLYLIIIYIAAYL